MSYVESCCGLCSIRAGAIIVAMFEMLLSLIGISLLCLLIINVDADDFRADIEAYIRTDRLEAACGFAITFFGIIFVINLMLISGIQRVQPALVNTWFLFNNIFLVFYILALFYSIFYAARIGNDRSLYLIFAMAARCGLQVYFLIVVYSFRFTMFFSASRLPTIRVDSPAEKGKKKIKFGY